MRAPLVMYHKDCTDGLFAAYAAWKILGDDADYVPVAYGDYTLEKVQAEFRLFQNREVHILDFSFPREVMDFLFSTCEKVIWLDHHKTAFEMYKLKPNETPESWYDGSLLCVSSRHSVVLDNTHSGAYIAWDFYNMEDPPLFIRYVDDYDRWQFKLIGTKEFQQGIRAHMPLNFSQLDKLLSPGGAVAKLVSEGKVLLKTQLVQVDQLVKMCSSYFRIGDQVGLGANCPHHLTSEVGHALANKSGTFGACWYRESTGEVKVSLRSTGDYDVSALAKKYGGGGHKNAAGFKIGYLEGLQLFFAVRWGEQNARNE